MNGTVLAWYMLFLVCLVSWTLHPKHRTSGSINADLPAYLILPCIAAGHILWQVHHYPGVMSELMTTRDRQLVRHVRAIEAPLVIVETHMPSSLILFTISAICRNIKRALFVVYTGLFCFREELFLHLSIPDLRDAQSNLNRPFVAGYSVLVWIFSSVVFLTFWFGLGIFVIYILIRHKRRRPPAPDGTSGKSSEELETCLATESLKTDLEVELSTLISVTMLPFGYVASFFLLNRNVIIEQGGSTPGELLQRVKLLIPRANGSVTSGLGQAMAFA